MLACLFLKDTFLVTVLIATKVVDFVCVIIHAYYRTGKKNTAKKYQFLGLQYLISNFHFVTVATLLFGTGESAIHHLFSRNTHLEFDYPALCTVLAIYFPLACWTAGVAISSGLVVPMLSVKALFVSTLLSEINMPLYFLGGLLSN